MHIKYTESRCKNSKHEVKKGKQYMYSRMIMEYMEWEVQYGKKKKAG